MKTFNGKRDQPPPGSSELLACKVCLRPTPHSAMAYYGARCQACYERYCREPQHYPETGNNAVDPKAWAHSLKAREEAGERLTGAQRTMWRSALHSVRSATEGAES